MLITLSETIALIEAGKLLHIAATEELLHKLPSGNWIGGSTEYFMGPGGCIISDSLLYVKEMPAECFCIKTYTASDIANITADAYSNGYSLVIMPFDSLVHTTFAKNASSYQDIFLKNIVGWVSGKNLAETTQVPQVVNGSDLAVLTDKAVVLHASLGDDRVVQLGIINIFDEDPESPIFEFSEDTFSISRCTVDGKEVVLADYFDEHHITAALPFIGDYSGVGINVAIKSVENGLVNLYAPVFAGISYRMAKNLQDYAGEFRRHLEQFADVTAVFSCNCVVNFILGELEGKQAGAFFGPITFGEIAFQLVNQTLVYMVIS